MRMGNELSHLPAGRSAMKIATDQQEAFCKTAVVELRKLGICFAEDHIAQMSHFAGGKSGTPSTGMDANFTAPLTTGSVNTPIQFLQEWLPGFVEIITQARKIDNLVGVTTQGSFEDEEIVQGVMEHKGEATPYGDFTNTPLASWNVNWIRRSIVRFEEGMQVGRLEEMRAARMRVNSADSKRIAAATALEINRNRIGFNGYNGGANRTYGFLNDPSLPAYVSVPNGAAGTSTWATKTFLEIVSDLLTALVALRVGSRDIIDVKKTPLMLALPTAAVDRLSTVSDADHKSVYQWLMENYSNITIESIPELDSANGGDNVFYLYAMAVTDSGSDDSRTFIQVVPSRFQSMGVDQKTKSYEESYANATAGIMLKRPYAVRRFSGI